MLQKTCKICNMLKPLDDYHKSKSSQHNRRPECKTCRKTLQQKYYQNNKQSILNKNSLWKNKNPTKVLQSNRKWKKENAEREHLNNKKYSESNREYIREYKRKWHKNKRLINPVFRLRRNISSLINNGYRHTGYSKTSKTQEIVGLDFSDLYSYLESTFVYNYGVLPDDWGWDDIQIDHVIPISSAISANDVLVLNHFTNLQLLISSDNLKKSNRV